MFSSMMTYRASEQDRQKYRRIMENSPRFGQTFASDLAAIIRAFPDSPLAPEEHIAINYYTGSAYDIVNAALRGDETELHTITQRWNQFHASYLHTTVKQIHAEAAWKTRLIVSGLNALPAYEGFVYRVTDLTPEQMARYIVGQGYIEVTFLSTSKGDFRNRYGKTYFVVQSKQGRDIEVFSRAPHEREVLFRPQTHFHVLKVEQEDEDTIIYLEEVR